MENSKKPPGAIFPWTPIPYVGESFYSWILRFCGAYQYTFDQLFKLTNINPKNKDWDVDICMTKQAELHYLAGVGLFDLPTEKFDEWLMYACKVPLEPRYFNKRPSYAWCDQCLLQDKEPYLRWRWRCKNFEYCAIHKIRLQETCPACESKYVVSSSLLRHGGSSKGLIDLSYCPTCGCSLIHTPRFEKPYVHPTVSASERKKIWDIDASNSKNLTEWLRISGLRRSSGIKMLQFVPKSPIVVFKPKETGPQWSRNLSVKSRAKLARAMQIIRRERNENRKNPTEEDEIDIDTDGHLPENAKD